MYLQGQEFALSDPSGPIESYRQTYHDEDKKILHLSPARSCMWNKNTKTTANRSAK